MRGQPLLVLQRQLRRKKNQTSGCLQDRHQHFPLHYTEEQDWTFLPFKITSEENFHSMKQRPCLGLGTARGTFHRFDQSI